MKEIKVKVVFPVYLTLNVEENISNAEILELIQEYSEKSIVNKTKGIIIGCVIKELQE